MWRSVLVWSGILVGINGAKVKPPVSKCTKHVAPLPLDVEVEGCTNQPPPCVLSQGQKVHISVAFRAPRYMTIIRTRASMFQSFQGIVYEMPIELEGNGHRTCEVLWEAKCPVRKGEFVMYPIEWTLMEPNSNPGDAAAVEIGNFDSKGLVMCLRIEFIIGAGNNDPFATFNRLMRNDFMEKLYS